MGSSLVTQHEITISFFGWSISVGSTISLPVGKQGIKSSDASRAMESKNMN
jgi:hypothetical protein